MPQKSVSTNSRPYARNSPKGKMLAEQQRRANSTSETDADIEDPDRQSADIPAVVPGTTPKRTRKAKK